MSQFEQIPTKFTDEREWLFRIAVKVNQILDGKTNNTGSVTLTANQASTDVVDYRLGDESTILFMPLTLNAAAEVATMYVQSSDIDAANNTFTINHANNSQTDRDFRYTIIG